MNFQDLHERLRLELVRRIELGNLTGAGLARQTGFRQAHISNFLNRRRSLSLDGLDRVLAAQELTVDQIMPLDLSAAALPSQPIERVQSTPVVSPSTAMNEAEVRPESVIETIAVCGPRLDGNRLPVSAKRAHWQRFVAIRADEQQAAAMNPMIAIGASVVLDRHYNSLAPYHAQQRTLYGVRAGAGLVLRYVEFDAGNLILRPLALNFPVLLLPIAPHETPSDYIVGRVCLVVSEL
jgi:hypothetical protein